MSLLLLSNEYDQWDKVERYDTLFRFLSSWGFYPRVVLQGQVNMMEDLNLESNDYPICDYNFQMPSPSAFLHAHSDH